MPSVIRNCKWLGDPQPRFKNTSHSIKKYVRQKNKKNNIQT